MNLRVRKKKNKSGSVSIVIVDRTNRGYKVVESLGSSKNELEIEALYQKALARIDELEQNLFHISKENSKQTQIKELLSDITTQDFIPIGDELVFGKLFSQLKCDQVFDNIKNIRKKDEKIFLFKSLVISRLLYPGSKLELINYLEYFKKIDDITTDTIYRFLDTLYKDDIKANIEECVFNHTKKIMSDAITVTFYDVTTLYFVLTSLRDCRHFVPRMRVRVKRSKGNL
jgi:hypothetical protein